MDPNFDRIAASLCGFGHEPTVPATSDSILPPTGPFQPAHLRLLPLQKSLSQHSQSAQYIGTDAQAAHEFWIQC
jgi:hypothetical protein